MQRIKILGFALMAVFALSAFVSATASAAGVVILPKLAVEEIWTGESGKGTLETLKGNKIVCQKGTLEGTIEAAKPLGLFHVHFEGCKGTLSGITAACSSLGHSITEETVLILGTYHLVWDKLGAGQELGGGLLFLLEHSHLECEAFGVKVLVLLLGEVLCLIKPVNKKAKHFEIVCELTKKESGDPGETVYWNENGTEVKMGLEGLLTATDDKTYEMGGLLTTALLLTKNEIEMMA